MNAQLRSLQKSLDNCKKGNWNELDIIDVKRMILYQEEQYCMNEESFTSKESAMFINKIRELVDVYEKNTGNKIELNYTSERLKGDPELRQLASDDEKEQQEELELY